MNQARYKECGQEPITEVAFTLSAQSWEMANIFIRIPFSGILIKFLSLRAPRLCGEIGFGQN